eukprot:753039-Hanusia_phi.AAC.5
MKEEPRKGAKSEWKVHERRSWSANSGKRNHSGIIDAFVNGRARQEKEEGKRIVCNQNALIQVHVKKLRIYRFDV